MRSSLVVLLCLMCAVLCPFAQASPRVERVETPDAYRQAVKQAGPGDEIVLANGTWRDFDMVLEGEGTEDQPITVRAETPGRVILSGQSSLRLGGSHLVVSGLVFRDGYSNRGEVISFRRNKDHLAHHSRVTQTVIDHFSNPDRFQSDHWVAMYGRHNRFDHNHLIGKTNEGVTMAVRLDSADSRENHHRIDHNYFGPRPVLGSNGGETLRIGTSAYSMFDSLTTVEANYFERCDGEVEIVSNKSGRNTYRGNVFHESQGTLTLRHGDGNVVEDNVFIGNGVANTGGIRVINRDQTVRNNYLEGLRGTGFASALTVMNGVPDSPVNRYVQVSNAKVERNTVVDSRRITLAGGSDAERSAPPVDSRFDRNLMIASDPEPLILVEDDVSGISFDDLLVGAPPVPPLPGVAVRDVATVRAGNGLLYPSDPAIDYGVSRDLRPVARDDTGVAWYAKPDHAAGDRALGRTIDVVPGDDTLTQAVETAGDGDILRLSAGEYSVGKVLLVGKTLTVEGPARQTPADAAPGARITFSRDALFELREGARLRLARLAISGIDAPDNVANTVLRTASAPMPADVRLELHDVAVTDLKVNKAFNVITLGKGTMAQLIRVTDSDFSNISGKVLSAEAETDDYGRYNVDRVEITGTRFSDIGGGIASVYRGGTDESTFGPHFLMSDCIVEGVGNPAAGGAPALDLHGVQHVDVSDNGFRNAGVLRVRNTVGTPRVRISGNRFEATPAPLVEELNHDGAPRVELTGNRLSGEPR